METFVFKNVKNENIIRFFRLSDTWEGCYIVELKSDDDSYEYLYWGNSKNNDNSRRWISLLLTIHYIPDSTDEWKELTPNYLSGSNLMKDLEIRANQLIENHKKNLL